VTLIVRLRIGESRRSIERGVGALRREGLPGGTRADALRTGRSARHAPARAGSSAARRAKPRPGCETPRRGFATDAHSAAGGETVAGGSNNKWLSTTAAATSASLRPLRCEWSRSIANALSAVVE